MRLRTYSLRFIAIACVVAICVAASAKVGEAGNQITHNIKALGGRPVGDFVHVIHGRHALCSAPGPHDYAAPLEQLPPIEELPRTKKGDVGAHLPFGPKSLAVYAEAFSPVLVEGGSYTYAFYNENLNHRLTLNWTVSAELQQLDQAGAPVHSLNRDAITITSFDDAQQPTVTLKLPAVPGFYRIDLQFTNTSGEPLGAYSEYLRVVSRSVAVRLGINGRNFRVGQVVATRVENVGTALLTFGSDYRVAHLTPSGWQGVRQLNRRLFADDQHLLEAGMASECSSFRLPQHLAAGRYRVTKDVAAANGRKRPNGVWLTARFSVARR